MGKTFHKITLCSTNDFKANKNDKIRGWVENNGGTFSAEIDHRVTHLVCTSKAWKRDIPIGIESLLSLTCPSCPFLHLPHQGPYADPSAVKAARRQKTVKIVSLNWLEDSLLSKTRKPLSIDKYSWVQRHWKRRQAEKAKQGDIGVSEKTGLVLEKNARKEAKDKSIEKAGTGGTNMVSLY
jgi:BRCA1 C Terminus (BRCT) domain